MPLSQLPEYVRDEITPEVLNEAAPTVEIASLSAQALTFLGCRSTLERCQDLSCNLGFTKSADFFRDLRKHLQLPLQQIEIVHEFFRKSIEVDNGEGYPSLRVSRFNEMIGAMRESLKSAALLFQARDEADLEHAASMPSFSETALQRALSCDTDPEALDANNFALYRMALHNFRRFSWIFMEKNILEGAESISRDACWVWFQSEQTRVHIIQLNEAIVCLEQETHTKEEEIKTKLKDIQTLQERKKKFEEKRKKESVSVPASLQKKKAPQESDREKTLTDLRENLKKAESDICTLETELKDFKTHELDFKQGVTQRLLEAKKQEIEVQNVTLQQKQDTLKENHHKKMSELTTSSETLKKQVEELKQKLQS